MTEITFQYGKVVMRDGKVGTEADCCCCQCGCESRESFPYWPTAFDNKRDITFTLGNNSTQSFCFDQMPSAPGSPPTYIDNLECVGCNYQAVVYLGTCYATVYFRISNPAECNCTTTEFCELEVVGWENEPGCPAAGSVINITLGDLC